MKPQTVFERLIAGCERALLHGKPILVLRTDEVELVRRIVESDRLVVRLSRDASQGVDRIAIKPTCQLDAPQPLQLFRANNAGGAMVNFNIHYVTKTGLRRFALDDEENYGMPMMAGGMNFPAMYVIPYQADLGNPLKMWEEVDLNPFIDRYLQESLSGSALGSSVLLVYGEAAEVPPAYQNYCEIIDEPYPEAEEIRAYLSGCSCFDPALHRGAIDAIADALLGLPLLQVERMIRTLSILPLPGGGCMLSDEKQAKEEIRRQKEQILKKSSLLELLHVDAEESGSMSDSSCSIGGMKKFKAWIASQERSIKEGDSLKREAGANPPKGVLLCGIPGCGKSMAVESVAETLKLPLLKMDVGQLMGKYVGESEHNMAKALKIAEAMAPCVLFIDELDKGFGGAGSGSEDSGAFKRMFGTLLTWMQDCKKPCFIFATANDISALPKEFFRSGRFDCLYSLFMPTADECADILAKQMQRACRRAKRTLFCADCYDRENLAELIDAFGREKRFVTGADIAKLVGMALRALWSAGGVSEPLGWDIWRGSILQVLRATTVYGDSKENLDSIALCCIRLLRSNFISASDAPLFDESDYKIRRKDTADGAFPEYEIEIDAGGECCSAYDAVMRETLLPLLREYGAIVEQNALRRML